MPARRGALMGRYALWQLRDYLFQQGPATAIVLALYGYLTLGPLVASEDAALRALPAGIVAQVFASLLGSLVLLGTLFATNGIVANDRKLGYYRFLFAKPVSAPRFYACAFAVNGVGLLLVSALLVAVFAAVVRPIWTPALFPLLAMMYVAYGGVGFLLSTIWRYDWLSLVTVAVAASFGWAMWGKDPGIKGMLVHLLPPMHRAGEIYAFAAGLEPVVPWTSVVWLGGYGLVCFLLGLWLLRVRSLATP